MHCRRLIETSRCAISLLVTIILASLLINSNAQCLEQGFLEDHEWRIHGVVLLEEEFEQRYFLGVARNMTLQDAREWCLQKKECSSLVFDFRSSKSLLTVDHVVFYENSLPYCNSTMNNMYNDASFWVAHVLKEKTEEPPPPLNQHHQPYNPYRLCCHENADRPWPTLRQLQRASNVERVSCNISRSQFIQDYESTHTPVILEGCAENWPAMTRWTSLESLQFSNDTMWKNECKGVLDPWHQVLEDFHNRQDAGIFDQIDGDEKSRLLQDYHVPAPFLTESYEEFATKCVGKDGENEIL